jgi:hypothetical protein
MLAALAADLIVLLHFSFILFVLLGALLLLRWRKLIWLHLPAVVWGAWVELSGWICPLTPLENWFRVLAGKEGYEGGFTEEYLLPLIYPEDLTRELQIAIGVGVLMLNLLIYAWLYRRWRASDK